MAAEVGAGELSKTWKPFELSPSPTHSSDQLAFLGHAERGEAVDDGERLLAQDALHGILERRLAAGEPALKVSDALAQE